MKGFKNANIYVEGKGIIKCDLLIENDKIAKLGQCNIDQPFNIPDDAYVLPGFIDEHIHGALGCDTMDGETQGLKNMAKALAREGTVGFLATTMTQKKENILKALKAVNHYMKVQDSQGATLLGVHLEGPYISEKFVGAQPIEYVVKPNVEEFDQYYKASGGNIKIVTVAPEQEGADKFIEHLSQLGVIASIGHTSAKCKDIETAIKCGASNVTHTFNAQSPLHHRDIGTVGSALLQDQLSCEVICDTIHVSVPAIKLLIKSKPHDKVILITDAMRAKHMPDGESELGGQKVIVKDGEARLLDGTLAGSVLKMNVAIKNLVCNGVLLCDAVDFATINPAKNLGIDKNYGSIKEGKLANFVVLDRDFNVLKTIINGKEVFTNA